MDPKGHAAIVTGAASGLGAETAAHLAAAGVKVACLDINVDGAKETARKTGGIAIRCDVTSSDSAVAALKEAREKHGPARILINCAGIGPARRVRRRLNDTVDLEVEWMRSVRDEVVVDVLSIDHDSVDRLREQIDDRSTP